MFTIITVRCESMLFLLPEKLQRKYAQVCCEIIKAFRRRIIGILCDKY